ncbi:hypothetical protein F4677DRAFT_422216 [Hypoxylon crocopeplum]|nr:hypothetical protein F4677DRAFT_422216 [Hypoxylon crocopeplum]
MIWVGRDSFPPTFRFGTAVIACIVASVAALPRKKASWPVSAEVPVASEYFDDFIALATYPSKFVVFTHDACGRVSV